jgi:uncharacterized protein YqhQ
MMRSPHAWAIAVRKPSGEVSTHSEPLERPSDKHKWMGWPVVRGVVTLGHAMTLGFRALRFSANAALDEISADEQGKKLEISGWLAAVNVILSLGFFIFMYKFVPLVAATELKRVNPLFGERVVFNLVDGAIRIALFLLFIWAISLMKDIRRVYQYHGAEHKTVFAFENGDPLETETHPEEFGDWPYTISGFTYHPQDLVFLSWFGQTPSTAVNSWHTFQGQPTLSVCQTAN